MRLRGVLFRIHDDLKSVSNSHASYLDDYTREAFDAQNQRITELQTVVKDPGVWVSDSFLMVQKRLASTRDGFRDRSCRSVQWIGEVCRVFLFGRVLWWRIG